MALDLTKKYLIQDILDGSSFTPYEDYLLKTTNERQYVSSGKGKEKTYKNQLAISAFNPKNFGGGVQDRSDLETFIMSDSLDLPSADGDDAGIVQCILDESE
jgi:hypothetical protein